MWKSSFSTIYWRDYSFSTVHSWCPCQRSVACICMGLFLELGVKVVPISWSQLVWRFRANSCEENESSRWVECIKCSSYLITRCWKPKLGLPSLLGVGEETGMLEILKRKYWQDLVTDYLKGLSVVVDRMKLSQVERERWENELYLGAVTLWQRLM